MPAEIPTTAPCGACYIPSGVCNEGCKGRKMTTPREVFRYEGTAGNRIRVIVSGCVTEDILETIDAFIAMRRKGKSAKMQEHPYVV